MEKIKNYKNIVKTVVEALFGRFNDGSNIYQVIIDEKNGHYFLYRNGWERNSYRMYGTVVHIEVKPTGKVWLQYDGTDLIIADRLLDKGIPMKDLVLGFHPPIVRADTEFAIG